MERFTIWMACFVLCLSLVAGNPLSRGKRQANQCFDDIPNVCIEDQPSHVIKYPHPSDNRKFLQCASGHRMFIIQCPDGEVYSQAALDCLADQATVTTAPHTGNNCTEENIQNGNIFFPNPHDNTNATFYQCKSIGLLMPLRCPAHLIFDPELKRCSLPPGTVLGSVHGEPLSPAGTDNPCTVDAVHQYQMFFPHTDPRKFFQCDQSGNAHVMLCPNNLIWNQAKGQCVSQNPDPFLLG